MKLLFEVYKFKHFLLLINDYVVYLERKIGQFM